MLHFNNFVTLKTQSTLVFRGLFVNRQLLFIVVSNYISYNKTKKYIKQTLNIILDTSITEKITIIIKLFIEKNWLHHYFRIANT
jgi:hypothetical protein